MKDYNDLYGAEGDWSLFDDYIRDLINNEDQALQRQSFLIGVGAIFVSPEASSLKHGVISGKIK